MWLPLLFPAALGYTLEGTGWAPGSVPVELHWTGSVSGFTHEDLAAAMEGAAAEWTEAAPCTFAFTVVEDPAAADWFAAGGIALLFGDPDDTLAPGVLYEVFPGESDGSTFTSNGRTYTQAANAEYVFADEGWATDAQIEAGACSGALSLQALLTHELGHILGLGHSCEDGQACPDPAAVDSTMYWSTAACDTTQSSLSPDDVSGIYAIYGTQYAFGFTCAHDPDDAKTLTCTASAPDDVSALSPTWDFGDGTTASGVSVTHTYADATNYDVRLCLQLPNCDGDRCLTGTVDTRSYNGDTGTSPTDDTAAEDTGTKVEAGCGCGHAPERGTWAAVIVGMVGLLRGRRRALTASA